jgi:probable phosphoglycerate mutase
LNDDPSLAARALPRGEAQADAWERPGAGLSGAAHEQATRIVAVRHGETAWNVDQRIQGQLDIGLNEAGREQARRLARALEGEGLQAVYASDLARAHDTARAVAEHAKVPLHADAGLRERGFGIFEGLTWAEIKRDHYEASRRWRARDAGFGPEGGEALGDFVARAVEAVAAIARRHRGQHIAVVTHGGVLDALYRAASRIAVDAPRTWPLGNASINRLLHGESGFTLVGWDDTFHLDDPALEESST